jgi:hypothetical protein
MARHSEGVPIEMWLPTWRVAMSSGVTPSPALTQAMGEPGAAAIPVGFAPMGTVRPATNDGNAIVVTELVSNSATRAVVPSESMNTADGSGPTGMGAPVDSPGREIGVTVPSS